MEFKKQTKKLVTASFIKRFHSWITSRSTDFFLSSSHDFLQFRTAAAILERNKVQTRRLLFCAGWRSQHQPAQSKALCVFLLIPVRGKAQGCPSCKWCFWVSLTYDINICFYLYSILRHPFSMTFIWTWWRYINNTCGQSWSVWFSS